MHRNRETCLLSPHIRVCRNALCAEFSYTSTGACYFSPHISIAKLYNIYYSREACHVSPHYHIYWIGLSARFSIIISCTQTQGSTTIPPSSTGLHVIQATIFTCLRIIKVLVLGLLGVRLPSMYLMSKWN